MNHNLKKTFDQIRAEEDLKQKTKAFLAQKRTANSIRRIAHLRLLPAAACFLLVVWGGYGIYFTPVSAISIDVNPSIELGINRFDKVVSVVGYDDDGKKLADSLKIRYMEYTEALDQILGNESVADYLAQEETLEISVIGSDEEQREKMLERVEACTAGQRNVSCASTNAEEVEAAHELGLSYGKYRAFLEVQELDPSITAEDVKGMTMREIRSLKEALSGGGIEEEQNGDNTRNGQGGTGNGKKGKQ